MSTYRVVNVCCLNSVLNVKALVCDFNQEKALFGAFSVNEPSEGPSFQALQGP